MCANMSSGSDFKILTMHCKNYTGPISLLLHFKTSMMRCWNSKLKLAFAGNTQWESWYGKYRHSESIIMLTILLRQRLNDNRLKGRGHLLMVIWHMLVWYVHPSRVVVLGICRQLSCIGTGRPVQAVLITTGDIWRLVGHVWVRCWTGYDHTTTAAVVRRLHLWPSAGSVCQLLQSDTANILNLFRRW